MGLAGGLATNGIMPGAAGQVAVLTANLSAISAQTTLQNATGLTFNIGSSATEIWFVECWVLVTAANATMDVKFALTGPAAATGQGGLSGGSAGGWSTGGTAATPSNSVGLGTAIAAGTPTSGESGFVLAFVVFGGGTAGACQLQYAQNTSDAGNLQILAGSFLRYQPLHS